MKQSTQDELGKIIPLLKIVKSREELYLQLLNFITKNIQSSSTQHEQLTIFTKFLHTLKLQQKQLIPQEKSILQQFNPPQNEAQCLYTITHVAKNNKYQYEYFRQILRFCSRLIQILDASISKTRNSIFNENGRLTLQFTRWKRNLHNIVKGDNVHLGQLTNHVMNYVRVKYKKQLAKVQKYIFKLQSGAMVALKDLYVKQFSQQESESKRRYYDIKPKEKSPNKEDQEQRAEHGSQTDSPARKSTKKQLLKTTKKGTKLYKSTRKQKQLSVHSDTKPPKQYAANKLLKFYNMMELSKKQFLEDVVYQKLEEQEHKKRLMNSLLEKNKTISCQISTYYKKTLVYHEKIKQMNNYVSSGEEKQRSSKEKKSPEDLSHSMLKNSSLRKSFVISKRKSSLTFQKNSKILTQNDEGTKGDIFIKNIKNLPQRRKSSAETTQRSLANKSKKLFVIKTPVMFEDDNIPQAPLVLNAGQGWFRPPLTSRKPQKKNENLRLKRRNNPLPIQNSLFNESFKFTDNKF